MPCIVTACMNRESSLKVSLPSWLNNKYINRVIIVDWSSESPLTDDIYKHPRVKLLRVDGQQQFHLAKAYNLAFKNATEQQVMKLDVDYVMNPYHDYFNHYRLTPGNFITGDHRVGNDRDPHGFIRYLNGKLYIKKQDFERVGGYNENLTGYGYDDEDLYHRLQESGLKRVRMSSDKPCCIFHIPHDDSYRSQNYEQKNIQLTSNKNYQKAVSTRVAYTKHIIDNIWCVNLQDQEALYEPYHQLGKGIKRWLATDSRGENKHVYRQHGLQLSPGSLQQQLYFSESPGAVGCFISHWRIWNHIITNQTPVTLVLEDDSNIQDVSTFIDCYDKSSHDNDYAQYDLIQLNKRTHRLNYPGDFNGTESYLITRKGAEKLVETVRSRPWFNNVVRDYPFTSKQQLNCYIYEPPQQWNSLDNCIVAAADKFIGMCGYGDIKHPNKLKILQHPMIGLEDRCSTIFDPIMTPLRAPFWEASKEWEVTALMNSDNFKWWERDQS